MQGYVDMLLTGVEEVNVLTFSIVFMFLSVMSYSYVPRFDIWEKVCVYVFEFVRMNCLYFQRYF